MIATTFARRAALPGLLLALALPTTTHAATDSGGLTAAPAAEPAPVAAPAEPAEPTGAPAAELPSADPNAPQELHFEGAGTWTAPRSASVGRPVKVSGRFHETLVGRRVRLQRQTPSKRWLTVATSHVAKSGRFSVSWRTRAARNHDLRLTLLAVRGSAHSAARSAATSASPPVRVSVLGRTRATWFGPGFYGSRTACGLTLRTVTEGVAHRTLPCGSKVEVRHRGRSVVLPVIDRGPFANQADFDLTKNVADRIGLSGVATVEYVERHDLPRLSTPYRAPAIRS